MRKARKFTIVVLGALFVGAVQVSAAESTVARVDFRPNPNMSGWLRGRYVYVETKTGNWRGEEEWTLTRNVDGSRTMRIFTLISATGVMRDFIHHVDANFRPVESYQSTWHNGVKTGSGYYLFGKNYVEAKVSSPNGTFTQRAEIDGPVTMVPHSMAGDGWHFSSYDRAKGGVQTVITFNPSAWGDGIQSVMAKVQRIAIALKGSEQVQVPAGKFEAEVWLIDQKKDGSWVNEIWVYGPDRIMVKFVDHPNGLTYLLDRLEQPKP